MNHFIYYVFFSFAILHSYGQHEPPPNTPSFIRSSVESMPREEKLKYTEPIEYGEEYLPLRSAVESEPSIDLSPRKPLRDAVEFRPIDDELEFAGSDVDEVYRVLNDNEKIESAVVEKISEYNPPPFRVDSPFQEIVDLSAEQHVHLKISEPLRQIIRNRDSPVNDYKVLCYITNWSYYRKDDGKFVPENIDPRLCTHGIYAYASLDANLLTIKPFDPWIDVTNGLYTRATSISDELPFLLGLGGWTDSTGDKYSRLVSDKTARAKFISTAIPFLKEFNFKGLHVDWNYPKCWQSDCKKGPASDKPNFTKFIQELSAAFKSEGLMLGVAISGYKEVIAEAYDVTALSRAVDLLTVMTYDYHGAWESQTGHVSPLFGKPSDRFPQYNTDYTIQSLIKMGADREKLIMGIPFYGQSFVLTNSYDSLSVGEGISSYAPGDAGELTKQPGMLSYAEICMRIKKQGWLVGRDSSEKAGPHANNRNQWVGYDDPKSVIIKAKYVKNSGIGGVAAWTIDLDDFTNGCCSGAFPLLRAINEILGDVKVPAARPNDCKRPAEPVTPPAVEMTTPTDNGNPGIPGGDGSHHEHNQWEWSSTTSTTSKPSSSTSWWSSTSTTTPTPSTSSTPSTQQTWWPTKPTTKATTTTTTTSTTTPRPTTTTRTTTTTTTTTTPRTTSTTRATTTPSWSQTTGTIIPGAVNHRPTILLGEKCELNEYRSHPEKCNSYYRCINNAFHEEYCAGGLHWNTVISNCDWPETAKCKTTATNPTTVKTPTTSGWVTRKSTPITSTTTTTTTQRPKTTKTTPRTTRRTTTQTTTTKPITTSTTTSTTTTSTPRPNRPFRRKCNNGEYYSHAECDSYYICVNGVKLSQQCDFGYQWNQDVKSCENKKKVRCVSAKQYLRWTKLRASLDDPCNGEQFVPYPSDCGLFFRCVFNKLQAQNCPPNLHWNAEKKVCDWPAEAKCEAKGNDESGLNDDVEEATGNSVGQAVAEKPVTSRPTTTTTTTTTQRIPIDPADIVSDEDKKIDGYYKVVCYFTNWAWYRKGLGKYTPDHIDPNLCTHIAYGFAVLDYSELTIRTHDSWADIDNKFYSRVAAMKEKGLKVVLALGGWNDSQGDKYSRLVRSPAARAKFIKQAIGFIEKYGFEGLDLDWEYPVCWQVDCKKGYPDEKEGFAALVKELSEEFKPKGLLLSSAVSPSKKVIDAGYDVPALAKYFDWIAVMTYDYHGQWDKKTGHVAPLFQHPDDDISYFNANYSINYFIEKGAPSRKLVMGMPLYGQSFTLSDAKKTGLNSQAPGPGKAGEYTRAAGFLAYYEICDRIYNKGWQIVNDERGRMGPYAYNGNQWVSYDDINMLRKKSQLIRQLNLGGGMIWALDLDDFNNRCGQGKHPLLKTIRNILADPPNKNDHQNIIEPEPPVEEAIETSVEEPIEETNLQDIEDPEKNAEQEVSAEVVNEDNEVDSAIESNGYEEEEEEEEEEYHDYKVVCYFTNWAWYRQSGGKFIPEDIDENLCTHIVYGFAVLNRGTLTIKPHDSWADIDNKFYERVVAYRKKGIKVTVAIGGWNDSAGDKYSRLVRSAEARELFVKNIVQFIEKYEFDGLDLDWEYPVCWQVDCKKGYPDEKEGFASLVKELATAFKPKGWLLSSAVSPAKKVIDAGYDVPTLSKYFDWIAVMTYDFHGQWDKKTGHVAPMYEHLDDFDKTFNANFSINYWIEQGADRKKIIMGMPMYGQSFSLADNIKNDLNSPTYGGGEAGEATRARGFLSYYEICHNIREKNWNVVRDRRGRMGPYAFLRDQWVSFDDIPMIRHKSEFVRAMGLGGAMIWALDLDDFKNVCGCESYPLLKTINRVLRNLRSKQPKCQLEHETYERPEQPITTTTTTTTNKPWEWSPSTTSTTTAKPSRTTRKAITTTTATTTTTRKPTSTVTKTTTTRETTTKKPHKPEVHSPSEDKQCDDGELFKAHEADCNKYYICQHGYYLEQNCPATLHWTTNHCALPTTCVSQLDDEAEIEEQDTPKPMTTTTRRTTVKPRPSARPPVSSSKPKPTKKPQKPQKPPVSTLNDVFERPPADYKMICYFTNWAWYRPGEGKYTPDDIDPTLCTHIVYGFATLHPTELVMRTHDSWADLDNRFYERVAEYKNKGVKVTLALGGWNDSLGSKYATLVRSASNRAKFIRHAVEFIEKYGFEGLDLDWEYPVCWQVECDKGHPDEKEGFAALVKELSAEFKPRGWFLSAAVSPSKKVIDAGYDVPTLAKYFDWIAVMTYDFHGHWDKQTGHVAPLYYYPGDTYDYFNANFTMNYWMELGAPAKKLIMGMPLYGQSFSLDDSAKRGLNAKAGGPGEAGKFTRAGGFLAYYEICEKVNAGGWNVVRDPEGRIGPYATKDRQWVSYDDVEDIRRKTRFIKSLKLGGGMVWALDLDDFRGRCGCGKHPLLRTINQELFGLPGAKSHDCT